MSVKVQYDRRADNTEAFAILAEAWNEMVQDGITPDNLGSPPYGPDSEVLFAKSAEGDIVGVIAWNSQSRLGRIEIVLAYVEASSRRKGVFREMVQALKDRVYSNGATRISAEVPVTAQAALHAFKQLGLVATAAICELKL